MHYSLSHANSPGVWLCGRVFSLSRGTSFPYVWTTFQMQHLAPDLPFLAPFKVTHGESLSRGLAIFKGLFCTLNWPLRKRSKIFKLWTLLGHGPADLACYHQSLFRMDHHAWFVGVGTCQLSSVRCQSIVYYRRSRNAQIRTLLVRKRIPQ